MKVGGSLDRTATPEEVCQAYEELSDEELYRLRKAATYCLLGSEYREPDEIINEAICRTMRGDRNWPMHIPFMAYLIKTFQGLGDDSRQSLQQRRTMQLEGYVADDTSVDETLGLLGKVHPDALTSIIEMEVTSEHQERARANLDKIEAHFSKDDHVTWIIMGLKDGLPAAEIQDLGGMTQTQYETAKRRFRRGVDKIFSEKRAS